MPGALWHFPRGWRLRYPETQSDNRQPRQKRITQRRQRGVAAGLSVGLYRMVRFWGAILWRIDRLWRVCDLRKVCGLRRPDRPSERGI